MILEDTTLHSRDAKYTRRGRFARGPDTPHRLGVLLDGEFYLDRVKAQPIIERLTATGALPPMSWLFIESGGGAARHADYTYAPDFSRFVAEDVVAWVGQHAKLVDSGHLICGLSLSGLAAAHLAITHPDRFSAALCQSGSFWHEPDGFDALVKTCPPRHARFYLSVGDQETDVDVSHPPSGLYQGMTQIDGVERARAALEPHAAGLRTHTYAGGHEFDPWRDELADALTWLLGSTG